MKLYTPHEIELKADYAAKDKHSERVDGWVCHYPGVDRTYTGELHESFGALRSIERYSISKGWWGAPYDYAVDVAGNGFLLRGTAQSGATSGDYDEDGIPNNSETDAILLLLGNGQEVTREMMDAVQELVVLLGGRRKYFLGHTEASTTGTSCPGKSVMDYIVKPMQVGRNLQDVAAPGANPPSQPAPHPVEPKSDWRTELVDNAPRVDLSRVSRSSSTWQRGDDVRVVQALLVGNGFAPENTIDSSGKLDGIGGPGTRKALVAAQRRFNLRPDATLHSNDYRRFLRGIKVLDLGSVTGNYRTWVRGTEVGILQALLVAHGIAPANTIDSKGRVDGVGGPGTRKALEHFQTKNKLVVDGVAGPNTYKKLVLA